MHSKTPYIKKYEEFLINQKLKSKFSTIGVIYDTKKNSQFLYGTI